MAALEENNRGPLSPGISQSKLSRQWPSSPSPPKSKCIPRSKLPSLQVARSQSAAAAAHAHHPLEGMPYRTTAEAWIPAPCSFSYGNALAASGLITLPASQAPWSTCLPRMTACAMRCRVPL
ncbi:hypothetical protein SETIT_4G249400v2 [Setaria italica]|uniref:Uncharacterized protein n=1 Tax=Setaria italica TaxID=4555 RepID=A0A368QXY9_SETIT|nr:hypothetical protein SETIT_4G249400v2 [Setaria italica]